MTEKSVERPVQVSPVPEQISWNKGTGEVKAEYPDDRAELVDNYQIDVEFAKEKLAKVERLFANLAAVMSKITPECYKHDRTKFNTLNAEADEQILKIESLLIGLSTKTEIEYSRPPWARRMVFWFLSFLSGRAWSIRQAYLNAWNTHNSLLRAVVQYKTLVDEQEQKISNIRYAKVNMRAEELLEQDKEYQKLKKEIPEARRKYNDVDGLETDLKRQHRNYLSSLNERIEQLRQDARNKALKEFSDEEF